MKYLKETLELSFISLSLHLYGIEANVRPVYKVRPSHFYHVHSLVALFLHCQKVYDEAWDLKIKCMCINIY